MACIYKIQLKNKTVWRAQLQLGRKRISATFDRKTDAIAWDTEMRSSFRRDKNFVSRLKDRRTVSDAIALYRAEVFSSNPNLANDRGYQLDWWNSQIGNVLLTDLDKHILREQLAILGSTKGRHGRNLSSATVNRYRAALSAVLTMAWRDWDLIEDNPFQKIKYQPENERIRFLERDEVERLRESCSASDNPYLETIFMIAICTGMRRGEILNLRRRDIRLREGLICIEKTKNHSKRSVPISTVLRPYLENLLKVVRLETDLLFPSANDCRKPVDIKNAWPHAVSSAGLEDYRFHDNRHTAATYLAFQNIPDIEIATILGHKTLAMVKRYAHLKAAKLQATIEKMNAEVFHG